jgi:hypothetical protein|tara:strand:+ start:453 stop:590 length:138 start_codon:yes stop_codon:yes gene_type:complete
MVLASSSLQGFAAIRLGDHLPKSVVRAFLKEVYRERDFILARVAE